MKTLSMETAHRVWSAHREIQVGTKLRDEMKKEIDKGVDPTPLDGFGRHRNIQMGVPMGHDSQRLLDIEPQVAVSVIDAHIATKRKELEHASIAARIELTETDEAKPTVEPGSKDCPARYLIGYAAAAFKGAFKDADANAKGLRELEQLLMRECPSACESIAVAMHNSYLKSMRRPRVGTWKDVVASA